MPLLTNLANVHLKVIKRQFSPRIHWPVRPVAHDFPLAQGQIHWPRASGQWLIYGYTYIHIYMHAYINIVTRNSEWVQTSRDQSACGPVLPLHLDSAPATRLIGFCSS